MFPTTIRLAGVTHGSCQENIKTYGQAGANHQMISEPDIQHNARATNDPGASSYDPTNRSCLLAHLGTTNEGGSIMAMPTVEVSKVMSFEKSHREQELDNLYIHWECIHDKYSQDLEGELDGDDATFDCLDGNIRDIWEEVDELDDDSFAKKVAEIRDAINLFDILKNPNTVWEIVA